MTIINEPLYTVGEKVSLLITIDESEEFYTGHVVQAYADDDVDGWFYQVMLDHNDESRWLAEDEIDSIPTPAQLKAFVTLLDRVLDKSKSYDRTRGDY